MTPNEPPRQPFDPGQQDPRYGQPWQQPGAYQQDTQPGQPWPGQGQYQEPWQQGPYQQGPSAGQPWPSQGQQYYQDPYPPQQPYPRQSYPAGAQPGYAPPGHRGPRRGRPGLLIGAAVLGVIVIGGGAAAVLASSSHQAPAALAVSSASPTATGSTSSASCHQQYTAWKTGSARGEAQKLVTDLDAVQAAANAEDVPQLTSALKDAGGDAGVLRRYPIPACADPGGYWNSMLSRIQAAGDNASTGSGLSALLLAEAPLKDVPGLESKLGAELKRTT